jgi:very-short-patch-repair endonuclease
MTPVARKLRRAMTDAEQRLWARLRNRQLDDRKFVAQFPIGPHVADFACRSAKLVIELDGGQHADVNEADCARTRMIEAYGYTVIRFWNSDVLENTGGVLLAISEHLRMISGD